MANRQRKKHPRFTYGRGREGCDEAWIRQMTYRTTVIESKPSALLPTKQPWELKSQRAARMAGEFMERFVAQPLMVRARAEGWGESLKAYAWDAATVQASIICGLANWGYTQAAYNWSPNTKQASREFERLCKSLAASGFITIEVPPGAIVHWAKQSAGA